MSEAGIIDANVFLRAIVGDQPSQAEQSRALLGRIANGEVTGILLPTVVLEIVFILEDHYDASRQDVVDALLRLFQTENLQVVDRIQLIDATVEYRNRRNISFADAYHCAMARDFHDGVIVSFDRKLSSVPGVQRWEPDDIGRG